MYFFLAAGVLFLFLVTPVDFSLKIVATLIVETLIVMGAAYFIIGKVSFFSALKAVGLSITLFILAGVFMLPALSAADPLAVAITVLVALAAATWGISIGLQASFGQAALIGAIFTVIYWLFSSLLGFGLSLSGAA